MKKVTRVSREDAAKINDPDLIEQREFMDYCLEFFMENDIDFRKRYRMIHSLFMTNTLNYLMQEGEEGNIEALKEIFVNAMNAFRCEYIEALEDEVKRLRNNWKIGKKKNE
jgi:hypothetical protein